MEIFLNSTGLIFMPEYTEKAVSGKLSVRKGDKQNEPEKRKLLAFRCACRKSYMAHGNSSLASMDSYAEII